MIECTRLANGLRVATRPMRSVETVAVGLYCETGSRFEPAELGGIAHLYEHMVFKGAGGRSARALNEAIEDVGGDLNASTDREVTGFYASLLAPDLPLGVELIADLIRRPHFEPADLELERDVVLQELAEAQDTPSDIVFDHLHEAAFPGQPLGRAILGSEESVRSIVAANLLDWRDRHYVPERMALIAAGKLEHARLVDLAAKHFGDLAPGAPEQPPAGRFVGGSRFEQRKGDQAHVAIAMPAPQWGAADAYASQLFADVVGAGSSSRLFRELRDERGLAYSVSAGVQAFADIGLLWTYIATRRDAALTAQAEIERILAETARDVTPREVERARALAKAGMLMNLESCWGQTAYVANRLLKDRTLAEPAEIVARLDAVTVDEVRSAGAAMVASSRALACVGGKLALAA